MKKKKKRNRVLTTKQILKKWQKCLKELDENMYVAIPVSFKKDK